MGAQKFSYEVGRIYSLPEVKSITSGFKFLSCQTTPDGVLFLYLEKGTHLFWVGGPLKGKGTNFFLFLGEMKTQSQLKKFFADEFSEMLKVSSEDLNEVNYSIGVHFLGRILASALIMAE